MKDKYTKLIDRVSFLLLIIFLLVWTTNRLIFKTDNFTFLLIILLVGCVSLGLSTVLNIKKYSKNVNSGSSRFSAEVPPLSLCGFVYSLILLVNLVLYKLGYVDYLILK